MSKTDGNKYDAIIIGAGISGLVCGCYLAKAGLKVAVVEQHDKPGGYFTSFKRKGFLFDAAAHSFGNYREGGHVRKIFTELGINDAIDIKRYDPSDIIITPDYSITLGNDMQATMRDLASIFPHEKNNITRFYNFLTTADQTEFIKLKDKTFGQLLQKYFQDTKLINTLSTPVFGNGGLPPSRLHAFSGAKIFSEFLIDGGYYAEGGIQNIPNALAQVIKRNSGIVKYRSLAKKILNERQSVSGVELENGDRLISLYVISAGDLTQTYKVLLSDIAIDEEKIDRVNTMIPSLSVFILYIGVDEPFADLPNPGTNVWYLADYDLDRIYASINKGDFDQISAFMLRVSPDRKTILAFMTAPFITIQFWKENKKKIADRFLDKIASVIRNLKQHIIYYDAATPSTLQRYTLNYHGAAYGWAKMPSQTGDIIASKESPLQGLFFIGHWTSIGFGMPGACYSGYEAARRILRNKKVPRESPLNGF
jgi:phytoene dehydrogenase-like protein